MALLLQGSISQVCVIFNSGSRRHLERRLPVSGFESCPDCHPERSEGSLRPSSQILRCAQDDRHYLQMSGSGRRMGAAFLIQRWYTYSLTTPMGIRQDLFSQTLEALHHVVATTAEVVVQGD